MTSLSDEIEALAKEIASDHQHTRAVGYQGLVNRIPAILTALRSRPTVEEVARVINSDPAYLADRLEALSQPSPVQREAVAWPGVRYVVATPTQEQRDAVCQTDLPKQGDAILVWINEGDLYMTALASPASRGEG